MQINAQEAKNVCFKTFKRLINFAAGKAVTPTTLP